LVLVQQDKLQTQILVLLEAILFLMDKLLMEEVLVEVTAEEVMEVQEVAVDKVQAEVQALQDKEITVLTEVGAVSIQAVAAAVKVLLDLQALVEVDRQVL
jgi:hypothetical protein